MNNLFYIISHNIFKHSLILLCDIFHSIYDKYDIIMNSNIKFINLYKLELEKSDIKNKLSMILMIIKIIIYKYNIISNNIDDNNIDDNNLDDYELIDYKQLLINCPQILNKSIETLLDIINKINLNIDMIYNKIEKYNKSYIKLIIKLDINNDINEIKIFNEIFNNRIFLFLKLIKLYKIKLN